MVVLRNYVFCLSCLLLLAVYPLASAQVLDPPSGDAAKSVGVVTAQASGKASEDSSGVKQASWYSLPMPKIMLPKIEMPSFSMPSFWASGDASSADKPSIFAPLTTGAQKISDGSKRAWDGAKDMFSFGRGQSDSQTSSTASQKVENAKKGPSLWDRMFTPKEPEGPRTVAEWMSQPRLDP
jgi:hypothetical protein